MFQICWHQHGGSGLGVTMGEALDLPIQERNWLLERIGEQRSREAREIEQASRKK